MICFNIAVISEVFLERKGWETSDFLSGFQHYSKRNGSVCGANIEQHNIDKAHM